MNLNVKPTTVFPKVQLQPPYAPDVELSQLVLSETHRYNSDTSPILVFYSLFHPPFRLQFFFSSLVPLYIEEILLIVGLEIEKDMTRCWKLLGFISLAILEIPLCYLLPPLFSYSFF